MKSGLILVVALATASAIGGDRAQATQPAPGHSRSGPLAPQTAAATIVLDDMRNFSAALSKIKRGGDATAIIKSSYIDRASPGLRAFMQRRRMTAQDLANAIASRPAYYAALANIWSRPERPMYKIKSAIAGLQRLYPQTQLLPIYIFVGNSTAGGLADPAGVLISAELYGDAKGVGLSELSARPSSVRKLDDIGYLAVHETVHIQQAIAQGPETYMRLFNGGTLLQLAIREGSADYLAQLASGGHTNPAAHAFGKANEKEVWRAFQQDMHGKKVEGWLAGRSARPGWPIGMGYFVGYKITEAYFRNSRSGAEAIRDVLAVTDYEKFLRASRYGDSSREQATRAGAANRKR
jgi:hypothetical protein